MVALPWLRVRQQRVSEVFILRSLELQDKVFLSRSGGGGMEAGVISVTSISRPLSALQYVDLKYGFFRVVGATPMSHIQGEAESYDLS